MKLLSFPALFSLWLSLVMPPSASAASSDPLSFNCRPERDANGGIFVRWPLRQGWVDHLEWSDTLEPESWQETGVSLYGATSSAPSNPNSDASVQVWTAPASGSGVPTAPVEASYTFFLQRLGDQTLVSYTVGGDDGARQSLLAPLAGDVNGGQWHFTPNDLPITWCVRVTGFGDPYWLCLMTQDATGSLPASTEPSDSATLLKLTQAKAFVAERLTAAAGSAQPAAAVVQTGPARFYRVRRESVDSDGSGLPDWFEWQYGMTAFAADAGDNPGDDLDGDGLSTAEELSLGTDPRWADSDGDGVSDANEKRDGTDPKDASSFGPVFYRASRWAESSHSEDYLRYSPWRSSSINESTPSGLLTVNQLRQFLNDVSPLPATPLGAWRGRFPEYFSGAEADYDVSPDYDGSYAYQTALWVRRQPAPATPIDCDFLAVGDNSQTSYNDRYSILTVTLPAGQTLSSPTVVDALPPRTYLHQDAVGQWASLDLLSLEPVPQVVRVNSDFDEQRLDPATGFAIPDCDDTGRTEADWLRIGGTGPRAGQLTTDDLSPGFFGPRPGSADFLLRSGTVYIRKKVGTDPETGQPEPGKVRLWCVGRTPTGQITQTWRIPITQEPTDTDTNLAPLLYATDYPTDRPVPWDSYTQYYYEGTAPGRITLEFVYTNGPSSFTYTKSFLVCTQQKKSDWLKEIRDQILLQSGTAKIDLNNYLPRSGYSPNEARNYLPQSYTGASIIGSTSFWAHKQHVKAIYDYYGQLFQQYPEKLDWMGAARLVGAAVYAGMSDVTRNNVTGAQQQLMGGQILIYRDLGWQHRAYVASGIPALDWVDKNDPDSINAIKGQRALEIDVWRELDKAIFENSVSEIRDATRKLVRREQAEVIVPMWQAIEMYSSGFLAIASSQAQNPSDPNAPLFQAVVPNGSLSVYGDRDRFAFGWNGNAVGAKGVFPIWWGIEASSGAPVPNYNAATRLNLVKIPLVTRAVPFSHAPLIE